MAGSREQMEQFEHEKHELVTQVKFLEEEVGLLRRRLTNAPRQVTLLEEKIIETREQLARAMGQNQKLADALRAEREKIEGLLEEVEKLSQPPASFGVYLSTNDDGSMDIFTAGRKMRVLPAPDLEDDKIHPGAQVILNESLNVVEVLQPDGAGEIVKVKDRLDERRVMVIGRGEEQWVAHMAGDLIERGVRAGDNLLYDPRSGVALELLPKEQVEELVLEEIPDVSYEDIGGLEGQIESIRDAVELPFLYSELFHEHELEPPKGVLLYGPPGCGKTLIAKAVAASLAEKVAERTGRKDARSYFLNVKGPELLNKYVGETERQIREIFQRAKERSEEGLPVIVFFDEMDSIFRTRGTGISSDVESTIVPQLLSELDGVETLKNVIVIGASNREDLIDPAILRPGRLDVKIKIERPNAPQAKDIMAKYLHPVVPIHPDEVGRYGGDAQQACFRMIDKTVEQMYELNDINRFLEVTYASGDKEILYFKDFNSGAMIENIVRRAKKDAIKRFLSKGEKGIKTEDLLTAIRDEFKENEDLPNTTNPDDWARISGKKGERIVYVRTLLGSEGDGRQVDRVSPGQYL
ncbi:MAG: proteasome-associated ATPase [Actinomycetota bacterium]|jgi:proteasome-associated ATPase|nr:proteasome-associated ATPase [Actinomycetota bacterium]MEA2580476.1 proteasome-associated ATPase [Actinomycetota bacterium]